MLKSERHESLRLSEAFSRLSADGWKVGPGFTHPSRQQRRDDASKCSLTFRAIRLLTIILLAVTL